MQSLVPFGVPNSKLVQGFRSLLKSFTFPYAETTLELPGWGGKIHACAVEDLVTITRGLKTRSIE